MPCTPTRRRSWRRSSPPMSPERVRPERLPRFLTRSRLSCAADPPNTHPLRLPRQLHAPVRTRRESLGSLGTHEPGKEIAFLRHMAPRRRATSGRGPANPHSPNALGPAGLPTPQSSLGPRSPNTEGKGASGLHPLADTQPAQSAFPILLTRDGGLRSPPGIRTRTSLRSNALALTCGARSALSGSAPREAAARPQLMRPCSAGRLASQLINQRSRTAPQPHPRDVPILEDASPMCLWPKWLDP
jgi:hypothetical protein